MPGALQEIVDIVNLMTIVMAARSSRRPSTKVI